MIYRGGLYCLSLVTGFGLLVSSLMNRSFAEGERSTFWSFQPLKKVAPPPMHPDTTVVTPVDAFILNLLEKRGLNPSPGADRRTLIRRATFDLTGLPPTLEEVNAFLADESPDAFAKVVDRLLASPSYGERWGRHWLDVVRYADARDLIQLPVESDFREAWRYRDWVIASFNNDLPYDQFIRMQIAGDILQPADKSQIDADALVATGLLSLADFVPGDVDKQQMIADYVNDQIDVVGRAVLGLTLACARCHDHKFDPITIEDYYSLAGIFFSSRLVPGPIKGNTPLTKVPLLPATEVEAIEAGRVRDKQRIGELTHEIATFGEKPYREYLDEVISEEFVLYLSTLREFLIAATEDTKLELAEFARSKAIDAMKLAGWRRFVELPRSHQLISEILRSGDRETAQNLSKRLLQQLTNRRTGLKQVTDSDPVAKSLADSLVLSFRADDPLLLSNAERRVSCWTNRGRLPDNVVTVSKVNPPEVVKAEIKSTNHPVLRFSGNESLQAPRSVPASGSLFVVFREDPNGNSGQRLIGWEDSSVGKHGVGIAINGGGALSVVLRKNGVSGDVNVAAFEEPAEAKAFHTLCITWGAKGVAVFRDGKAVGTNNGIDAVSSDPEIHALQIGGPGSGSSSRFQGDLAELRVYDVPLDEAARNRVEAELAARWFTESTPTATDDPIASLYDDLISGQSPYRLDAADRESLLSNNKDTPLAALRDELEQLRKKPAINIPQAVVVQEGGPVDTPHAGFRDARVFLRGNHTRPDKTVPRGFPKVIEGTQPVAIREGSGRRELADWLTRPENPLTARVIVNRVWQHHFGVGLVPTSANFGAMGEEPSHPELLDYLASRFVDSGWSIKSLHRLIMMSSVYQQSSNANPQGLALDPENKLLWRANRRRLEAEAIRDSTLALSGLLSSTMGGVGFTEAKIPRRTVYLMSVRTGAKTSEFGPLFDAPDCSGIVERRTESIVAPQALYFMNDPLTADWSNATSDRIRRESTGMNLQDQIKHLYGTALSRMPSDEELDIGKTLLGDGTSPEAWAGYCRLILSTNEFLFID